jgi:hypothetical protein
MDGSNGNMIALLERIAKGVEEISARVDQTNARLDQTNARLDNVIDFMSRYFNDHEGRIRALEDRVFAKSG